MLTVFVVLMASCNRILGGKVTKIEQFPHHVTVEFIHLESTSVRSTFCGGSILADSWVLTAAHCIPLGKGDIHLRIYFGMDKKYSKIGATSETAKIVVVYKSFKIVHGKPVGDITLVKLADKISFSERIKPVFLPKSTVNESSYGSVLVTGFGSGDGSDQLKVVRMDILNISRCQRHFGSSVATSGNLCIQGSGSDQQNVCEGDSGGGAVVKLSNGSNLILGIVSHGHFCQSTNFASSPQVFTRVSYYVNWIKRVMDADLPD